MTSPITHILTKSDYTQHRLVTLPSDPLPPLAPSSLRLRSRIIGLTTNNFTYAKLGFLLGWWDVYPPPQNTPSPYDDHNTYGRISAWGYAEILSSTVPGIEAGQSVYGYLPISTGSEDVEIEKSELKNHILVTSPHRQHLWKIYNRYQVLGPIEELEKSKSLDFLGWDALMQALFGTAFNLNTYGLAWDKRNLIHPSGNGAWTLEDADLGNATVIILSASTKTGLAFAYQLRNNRPKEHQPHSVIGVCSSASQDFVKGTGLYDTVLLYNSVEQATSQLETNKSRRIVLLDFGARDGVTASWTQAFSSLSIPIPFTFIGVGESVGPKSPEEIAKIMQQLPNRIQTNANELREKGLALDGDEYLERFHKSFDEFKSQGGIPGVKLRWEEGLEAWEKGWERLAKDEVGAGEGLVFRI